MLSFCATTKLCTNSAFFSFSLSVDDLDGCLQYVGGTGGAIALTGVAAATALYYATRPTPEKPLVPLDNQCPIEDVSTVDVFGGERESKRDDRVTKSHDRSGCDAFGMTFVWQRHDASRSSSAASWNQIMNCFTRPRRNDLSTTTHGLEPFRWFHQICVLLAQQQHSRSFREGYFCSHRCCRLQCGLGENSRWANNTSWTSSETCFTNDVGLRNRARKGGGGEGGNWREYWLRDITIGCDTNGFF